MDKLKESKLQSAIQPHETNLITVATLIRRLNALPSRGFPLKTVQTAVSTLEELPAHIQHCFLDFAHLPTKKREIIKLKKGAKAGTKDTPGDSNSHRQKRKSDRTNRSEENGKQENEKKSKPPTLRIEQNPRYDSDTTDSEEDYQDENSGNSVMAACKEVGRLTDNLKNVCYLCHQRGLTEDLTTCTKMCNSKVCTTCELEDEPLHARMDTEKNKPYFVCRECIKGDVYKCLSSCKGCKQD